LPTTTLSLTAADHDAQRKPAPEKIAPLAFPPTPAAIQAALCTAQISPPSAQICTNGKCLLASETLVTIANYYHLDEIGFDQQNRGQPVRSCALPRRRWPESLPPDADHWRPNFSADPCTILHKRPIPAQARDPRNYSQPLPLRRNWLRSAKSRATRPILCASETSLARVLAAGRRSLAAQFFRDPCTILHKRPIPAQARDPRNHNQLLPL
jgi:hypothetical protein